MTGVRDYVAFVAGCLLLFGGAYMAFVNLDSTTLAMEWGILGVLGMFPLVYALPGLLLDGGESTRGERGNAPGKTQSYFGRK